MDIHGIDFTSSPGQKKPITCLHCRLCGDGLRVGELSFWTEFAGFERMLATPGPWIAGIDFPFGLPRRFVRDVKWPSAWQDYVRHARNMGKDQFEATIERYRKTRPYGKKQPGRWTDKLAGGRSPLKLDYQPVGKMFFQGAPRLTDAGVAVPGLQDGDRKRVVVEAYPGALVRSITKDAYKHDKPKGQTAEHRDARCRILEALTDGSLKTQYGITVVADASQRAQFVEDPTGDSLDALLCAVQAAWAWLNRDRFFNSIDPAEGGIADPRAVGTRNGRMRHRRSRPDATDSSKCGRAGDGHADDTNALQDEFESLREQAIWLRQTFNTFECLFHSDPDTERVLQDSAGLFFGDLNRILQEYYILLVCRLTGPAKSADRDNLSIRRFTAQMRKHGCGTPEIRDLGERLVAYGEILAPARNRLVAHSDLEAHANPTVLGRHEEEQAAQFLDDLQAYFDAAGNAVGVGPLDFRHSPGPGDAIDLVACLQRASAFRRSADPP